MAPCADQTGICGMVVFSFISMLPLLCSIGRVFSVSFPFLFSLLFSFGWRPKHGRGWVWTREVYGTIYIHTHVVLGRGLVDEGIDMLSRVSIIRDKKMCLYD